ncbi:MAG: hypothetical protein RR557_07505 [Bacilli bacterium]
MNPRKRNNAKYQLINNTNIIKNDIESFATNISNKSHNKADI